MKRVVDEVDITEITYQGKFNYEAWSRNFEFPLFLPKKNAASDNNYSSIDNNYGDSASSITMVKKEFAEFLCIEQARVTRNFPIAQLRGLPSVQLKSLSNSVNLPNI